MWAPLPLFPSLYKYGGGGRELGPVPADPYFRQISFLLLLHQDWKVGRRSSGGGEGKEGRLRHPPPPGPSLFTRKGQVCFSSLTLTSACLFPFGAVVDWDPFWCSKIAGLKPGP